MSNSLEDQIEELLGADSLNLHASNLHASDLHSSNLKHPIPAWFITVLLFYGQCAAKVRAWLAYRRLRAVFARAWESSAFAMHKVQRSAKVIIMSAVFKGINISDFVSNIFEGETLPGLADLRQLLAWAAEERNAANTAGDILQLIWHTDNTIVTRIFEMTVDFATKKWSARSMQVGSQQVETSAPSSASCGQFAFDDFYLNYPKNEDKRA
jgi:hypothetical protein